MTFHPQYIVNEHKQTTAVILPVAEWDSLLEEDRKTVIRTSSMKTYKPHRKSCE